MSDLISRKKLKAIIEPMVGMFKDDGSFWWSRDSVLSVINSELVEAEPKVGKWIRIGYDIYECSECHQYVKTGDIDAYDWCHHCGAKMER